MITVDLLTLLAILGSFNSLLVATILVIKYRNLHNQLLALLLYATSIRIAKNIVVHIKDIDPELNISREWWRFLVNFGISHQFAIGPLFFLYLWSWTQPGQKLKWHHWYHFIPFLVLVAWSPWTPWQFWKQVGLWLSYISILAYYLIALLYYKSALDPNNLNNHSVRQWLGALMIFVAILLLAYSPALFKYIGYIGGAGLYAVGLLASILILTVNKKFLPIYQIRYRNHQLTKDQSMQVMGRIDEVLISKKRCLDPEISLNTIAKDLGLSHTAVSRAVNESRGLSFSKYINQLRIQEAKLRLKDPVNSHLKIAAIAFDCGFGAISTFNTAFKEFTGISPKEYRTNHNHQ